MTKQDVLTKDHLHKVFEYRDGVIVRRWDEKKSHRINYRFAGKEAGAVAKVGYRLISIGKFREYAHRIVWIMHNGAIPYQYEIDHVNGDKLDNRIENLRLATRGQNSMNKVAQINNTSGCKGVVWDSSIHRWRARLQKDGRMKYLGIYSDKSDAITAVMRAIHVEHGDFARLE